MDSLNTLGGPLPDRFRQLDDTIEQFQKVGQQELHQNQGVDQKVSDASKGVFSPPSTKTLEENVAAVRKEAIHYAGNVDSVMEKLTASIEKLAENSFNPSLTTEQKEAFKNSYKSLLNVKASLAGRLQMEPMKPGYAHHLAGARKVKNSGAKINPQFNADYHRMNLHHNGVWLGALEYTDEKYKGDEVNVKKYIEELEGKGLNSKEKKGRALEGEETKGTTLLQFYQMLREDGLTDDEISELSYRATQELMGDTARQIMEENGLILRGGVTSKIKMEINTQDGERSIHFEGDFGLLSRYDTSESSQRVSIAIKIVDFTLNDPDRIDTFRSIVFYDK